MDRASDVDENYEELAGILTGQKTYMINPIAKTRKAIDKSIMHSNLLEANLSLPYTIVLPPSDKVKDIDISKIDFSHLGIPFIIKPALYTGGGEAVITNASTTNHIQYHRMKFSNDHFLIQSKVYPGELENRRAWFRVFWAFGKVIPTWWDDETHIYEVLKNADVEKFKLKSLFSITRKIAAIADIDYFSTEIAYSKDKEFVQVDYVNDQCDMRLKSKHFDGVPDEVVAKIIKLMMKKVISL